MEYLITVEGSQFEATLDEMLGMGDDLLRFDATKQLYTGVKDIKGNKIYDQDVVIEHGHYVNSDRPSYRIINFAPNHGAWLRGKTQRLTPKNVKNYSIEVVDRKTEFYKVPKRGYYLVGREKNRPGRVDYYPEGELIPSPIRVNFVEDSEAWDLIKKQKQGEAW